MPEETGLVINMSWTNEQRAFAVKAYLSNNNSVIAAQRSFRTHYKIAPRASVPDRKSILLWVSNFRETGSVVKKTKEIPRSVRTAQKIDAVRQSILQFPNRSLRKHAARLQLSNRTLRRILHQDLQMESIKLDQSKTTKVTPKESNKPAKKLPKSEKNKKLHIETQKDISD